MASGKVRVFLVAEDAGLGLRRIELVRDRLGRRRRIQLS
jgi:hypothetical protein